MNETGEAFAFIGLLVGIVIVVCVGISSIGQPVKRDAVVTPFSDSIKLGLINKNEEVLPIPGTMKNLHLETKDKEDLDYGVIEILINDDRTIPPLGCVFYKSSSCSDTIHTITVHPKDKLSFSTVDKDGRPLGRPIYYSLMFLPAMPTPPYYNLDIQEGNK